MYEIQTFCTSLAPRFAIIFEKMHIEMRLSSKSTCGTVRKQPLKPRDVSRLMSGNLFTVPKIPQAGQWSEAGRGVNQTCCRARSWKGFWMTLANRGRSGAGMSISDVNQCSKADADGITSLVLEAFVEQGWAFTAFGSSGKV